MRFVLFYLLFGTTLAAGTIALPACRRHIRTVAGRLGMSLRYASLLWISGAVIAWPAGLYVLSTGRLLPPARGHDDADELSSIHGDGG